MVSFVGGLVSNSEASRSLNCQFGGIVSDSSIVFRATFTPKSDRNHSCQIQVQSERESLLETTGI